VGPDHVRRPQEDRDEELNPGMDLSSRRGGVARKLATRYGNPYDYVQHNQAALYAKKRFEKAHVAPNPFFYGEG
jgi:hypothetical protein